jgi:hypothetical protein
MKLVFKPIFHSGIPARTVNPLEYAQEGDLLMPIMEINEKLTRIIQERSIELVTQEEGLVTIVFDDYSTASLRVP